MSDTEYEKRELSQEEGTPIELYLFSYNNTNYLYTSANTDINYTINDTHYAFSSEFIYRSETLKLGNTTNDRETCNIVVYRTNPIAILYQGAPPEEGEVRVQIFRVHDINSEDFIKLVDGVVSQVVFEGSEATMTVTIENVLSRNMPKGTFSYFCQNCIYDHKCGLSMDKYGVTCTVKSRTALSITSDTLLDLEDGYFTDGFIKMGDSFRQIKYHSGNTLYIKYPISELQWKASFTAYPGCSNLFANCAKRFNNHRHFSGVCYIQPYNAYKHPVINDCAYWVNSSVISRDTDGKIYSMGL